MKYLYVTLLIATLGVVAFFGSGSHITRKWVGRTDLEVRFIVTDSKTGDPIPDATVSISAEKGGLCEDKQARRFELTTDKHGQAAQVCRACMCFGSRGTFEDTYVVHLPSWWFQTSASGYSTTDLTNLDMPEYITATKRGRPYATLAVPIRLERDSVK